MQRNTKTRGLGMQYGVQSKRRKAQKIMKRVAIFAAVLAAFVCALLAASPFRKQTVVARRDLYALCFYEGKDVTEANLAAQSLTLRGGAGYVQKEGGYRVLACVYFSREKATEVCKNIVRAGGKCRVIPLTVNAVRLPKKRRADANLLAACNALFEETITSLSAAFAAADRGEQRALIQADLSALSERLSATRSALLYEEGVSAGVRHLSVELLASTIERLRSLEEESNLFALSVQIKYTMLQIVDEFRAFCEKIR